MVAHTFDASTWKVEARGLPQICSQLNHVVNFSPAGPQSKTVLEKKNGVEGIVQSVKCFPCSLRTGFGSLTPIQKGKKMPRETVRWFCG